MKFDSNCNSVDRKAGLIWRWDANTGELIEILDFGQTEHTEWTYDLALSSDGAFLASAQSSWSPEYVGTVRLWQLTTRVNTENKELPLDVELVQNYPNPFNSSTTIAFQISNPGFVSLQIFDLLGRRVETLVEQRMAAGSHSVEFYADTFPVGTYFYRLETGTGTLTRRMQLVK